MNAYYQSSYNQRGLTTELPSALELDRLLQTNFSGTQKDLSRVLSVLSDLGVSGGASVFDYGASWGYAAFQFQKAGYLVKAYELSKKRAALGGRIGIKIETDLSKIGGDFDVVYSSHVVEHMSNPLKGLQEQFARVKKGGYLIARTPNGSLPRRRVAFHEFRQHWGLVHPVLLSDRFIATNFGDRPFLITSHANVESIADWDRTRQVIRNLEGSELFFIIRRP